MAENTKIQWCNHTFNGWRGCEHATLPDGSEHPGCANCYAEAFAPRNPKTLGVWGHDGTRVRGVDSYWRLPIKWNAAAEQAGVRARVFALSLGDVFEDWQGPILGVRDEPLCIIHGNGMASGHEGYRYVSSVGRSAYVSLATLDDLRRDLFALIDRTPWLDWILLTKRPQNVRNMVTPFLDDGRHPHRFHRENIWLLTSVSNQATADAMIDSIADCADLCSVVGISLEPMLGPVILPQRLLGLGERAWCIIGGESGPGSRPCNVVWVRSVIKQCQAAGVPVFVKQLGAKPYDTTLSDMQPGANVTYPYRTEEEKEVAAEALGDYFDGVMPVLVSDKKGGTMEEWPIDLRVREFPK